MAEDQQSTHFLDYWRVLRSRKEIVIAIALLIVIAGVLITLFVMPKVYMASTRIAVEESQPDLELFTAQRYQGMQYFVYLKTQFEIIQSDRILYEVIRNLDLGRRFGDAYGYAGREDSLRRTLQRMKKAISVQQYRDTNLIEIRAYVSKPTDEANELAAQVANEIALVFRKQREDVKRNRVVKALDVLYREQLTQENKVKKLEEELAEFRRATGIFESGRDIDSSSDIDHLGIRMLLVKKNEKLTDARVKNVRAEAVEELSDEDLLDASEFIYGNTPLVRLRTDRNTYVVEVQELLHALGPKHPQVLSLEDKIAAINTQLKRMLAGFRIGVNLDARTSKAEVEAIEEEIQRVRSEMVNEATTSRAEYKNKERILGRERHVAEVLKLRWIEEKIELEIPRTTVEVIDRAVAPPDTSPSSPNIFLNVLISVLLGVGCGVGVAFFMEYVDTTIKTVEDIERFIGTRVLGIIPQRVLPLMEEGPESAHAEAYRVLRTNLKFASRDIDFKTLCVTSGSVGEGKSLTTANLAYVSAVLGDRVLVVDSDLRRPRQDKIFGISNKIGLANVLLGEMDLTDVIRPTEVGNLSIVTSGRIPQSAQGILDNTRTRDLIEALRDDFDLVILDSPPLMGVSDASVLVSEVDGTLLVVQYHKYPRSVSTRAKSMIDNVGGNLLGVALNNINIARDSYYYYYYHTYYSAYNRPETIDTESVADES